MEIMGSINFKLKEFKSEYDSFSGFTNVYVTLVSRLPEDVAREIISFDTNFAETLRTNIAKEQVKYILSHRELFNKMIEGSMDIDGDSQEEAIKKITDWEFWKDQIEFDLVEFIQE